MPKAGCSRWIGGREETPSDFSYFKTSVLQNSLLCLSSQFFCLLLQQMTKTPKFSQIHLKSGLTCVFPYRCLFRVPRYRTFLQQVASSRLFGGFLISEHVFVAFPSRRRKKKRHPLLPISVFQLGVRDHEN
jgi:hypothetical protein